MKKRQCLLHTSTTMIGASRTIVEASSLTTNATSSTAGWSHDIVAGDVKRLAADRSRLRMVSRLRRLVRVSIPGARMYWGYDMVDGAGKRPGVRLETHERAACLPRGSALHPIIAVIVSLGTDVGKRYSRRYYSSCTRCNACVFEFKESKRVHPIGCSRRSQHDSKANVMLYLLVNGFAMMLQETIVPR